MPGYTPVFDSVFEGTLCGRWPALPVWLTILPMMDKHGHIDKTYHAISLLSGWSVELLQQGIAELMQPDPQSRTPDSDGRRLELLDPEHRQWGWRVINHRIYREKARKSSFDAARSEDGRNRERMQERRSDVTRDDPRSPEATRDDPPSDSNANASKRASKKSKFCPPDFPLDLDFARNAIPDIDADREAERFRDWEFARPKTD